MTSMMEDNRFKSSEKSNAIYKYLLHRKIGCREIDKISVS